MSLNMQHMPLSMISEFLPDAQLLNMPSIDQAIKRFISDSRQVVAGDVFIALRGEKFDAHDFLNDVQAKGALACLVSSVEKLPQGFPAIVVKDTQQAHVEILGAYLESHDLFPKRVNVGFMEIVSSHHIRLRVFERGVGETLACGTGACAAVVSGIKRHLLTSPVKVDMLGGSLSIDWKGSSYPVMMKGPAVTLYEGDIEIT